MGHDLATSNNLDPALLERVIVGGDLANLTPQQRVTYYGKICENLGLNPLTRPFEYLTLNGKLILYARRECTEQLRKVHAVSIGITARELVEGDCYAVTARAVLPDGRTDESIGVKSLGGAKGDARANAMMTAETKAKRRVTLSICGLGMLDETEVGDLPPAATRPAEPRREAPALPPVEAAPPAAPLDHLEPPDAEGAVRVARVDKEPTKNPNVTRWTITLSTGEQATTINAWLASFAEQCRDQRLPVRAETKSHKLGTDLVALQPIATARPAGDVEDPLPF